MISPARRLLLLLTLATTLFACTTVGPPTLDPEPPTPMTFSHDDFDAFLRRMVDTEGRVDYAAAAADRADLDRYLAALAARSPDSHPEVFPHEHDRLAYWINAYNASAIALVLREYPIAGVRDVRPLGPFSFLLPKGAGFFLLRRVVLGGKSTTLYGLENVVIRRRFDEPRIHFALNCASIGCPRLPAEAFEGARLETQLARETTRFLAERRNAHARPDEREIALSSIFDWFEDDFTGWLERRHPGRGSTLEAYVRLHAGDELARELDACADCDVVFVPYDWGLNAQPAPAP